MVTGSDYLDVTRVRRALGPDSCWVDLRLVASTGSTNEDLVRLSALGAAEGTVIATDDQTAGRGRLARSWVSPRGSGVAASMLLRPRRVPRESWSWLPLVAGIAVVDALEEFGVAARLKWPNDLLVDGRKIAGILVEVADRGAAAVVGVGINVSVRPGDLLTPQSTSIGVEVGHVVDPSAVLGSVLQSLDRWYGVWRDAASPNGTTGIVATAYAERSGTLGERVHVLLADGTTHAGTAIAIDANGALVVMTEGGPMTFASGDVVHVR